MLIGRVLAKQWLQGRRSTGDALKDAGNPQDGQKQYVSLAFSVVKDREGKVIGAMATAREFVEKP